MIPDLIPRTDWEEPGWTVAEHTNAGPHPFNRTTGVVIHYTGASSTPENEATVRGYIRSIQRDYAKNRGYSIGYNWVVDRQGRVWEARGDGYKCAANGNSVTNNNPAILCLVNGSSPANEPMTEAIRDVVNHCQQMAGDELTILGHRDVRATACPGNGLYDQVLNDDFKPRWEQLPPTPPEDNMARVNGFFIRVRGTQDHFLCIPQTGDSKARLEPDEPSPLVLTGDIGKLEDLAGYPLTPMPGE